MSTKIGIITEGSIDQVLLPPLLSRIATDKAQLKWPLEVGDVAEVIGMRKRGHGGVLETVRKLIKAYADSSYEYVLIIILLDRRTKAVQEKIRGVISHSDRPDRFVLGIAIEEIEAWWLGDRKCTLA